MRHREETNLNRSMFDLLHLRTALATPLAARFAVSFSLLLHAFGVVFALHVAMCFSLTRAPATVVVVCLYNANLSVRITY